MLGGYINITLYQQPRKYLLFQLIKFARVCIWSAMREIEWPGSATSRIGARRCRIRAYECGLFDGLEREQLTPVREWEIKVTCRESSRSRHVRITLSLAPGQGIGQLDGLEFAAVFLGHLPGLLLIGDGGRGDQHHQFGAVDAIALAAEQPTQHRHMA